MLIKKYMNIFENKNNQSLNDFFKENWTDVKKIFKDSGIVLFRNFNINNPELFHESVNFVHKKIKNYTEASTPRTKVNKKVYTSTEYPKHKDIPLHNEMSYSKNFPKNLWFFCQLSAEKGGETTYANSQDVFNDINPGVVKEFKKKQIKYVRRYGYVVDLSCEDVFGTKEQKKINKICEEKQIEYKWEDENKLVTKETNQVTLIHPLHKFEVWFNQAHLFHHTNVEKKDREILQKIFGKGMYPRDVVFGDNKEIPEKLFTNIREAYLKNEKKINWEPGDIALIDNLHIAHGRKSFLGERKVFVSMTDD